MSRTTTTRMTRDELLRRGAAASALLSLPSLLAACGGGDDGGEASGELKDVLNFSNWELYIDTPQTRKDAGLTGPTTLQQFTTKTQIKVNYFEDVNSNSEYFATVQGRLAQGQGIGRDILVSTDNDRFLGEYLDNDWALMLDKDLIRTSSTSSARRRALRSTRTGSSRSPGSLGWTASPGTRTSPGR